MDMTIPTKILGYGDITACKALIGLAMQLVGVTQNMVELSNGLNTYTLVRRRDDGSFVQCIYSYGSVTVKIFCPPVPVVAGTDALDYELLYAQVISGLDIVLNHVYDVRIVNNRYVIDVSTYTFANPVYSVPEINWSVLYSLPVILYNNSWKVCMATVSQNGVVKVTSDICDIAEYCSVYFCGKTTAVESYSILQDSGTYMYTNVITGVDTYNYQNAETDKINLDFTYKSKDTTSRNIVMLNSGKYITIYDMMLDHAETPAYVGTVNTVDTKSTSLGRVVQLEASRIAWAVKTTHTYNVVPDPNPVYAAWEAFVAAHPLGSAYLSGYVWAITYVWGWSGLEGSSYPYTYPWYRLDPVPPAGAQYKLWYSIHTDNITPDYWVNPITDSAPMHIDGTRTDVIHEVRVANISNLSKYTIVYNSPISSYTFMGTSGFAGEFISSIAYMGNDQLAVALKGCYAYNAGTYTTITQPSVKCIQLDGTVLYNISLPYEVPTTFSDDKWLNMGIVLGTKITTVKREY